MIKNKKDRFSSTVEQKILDFLCKHPHESFYGAEIALRTLLSKGGTNQALRKMAEEGLLKTEKKGRMVFYGVDPQSAIVKQFKILKNVDFVDPLIDPLRKLAQTIVLFGSRASGEDSQDSDMDLFIVSRDAEKIKSILLKGALKDKIQLIVKTPQEYAEFEKKEPVLYGEIKKGIILWEKV